MPSGDDFHSLHCRFPYPSKTSIHVSGRSTSSMAFARAALMGAVSAQGMSKSIRRGPETPSMAGTDGMSGRGDMPMGGGRPCMSFHTSVSHLFHDTPSACECSKLIPTLPTSSAMTWNLSNHRFWSSSALPCRTFLDRSVMFCGIARSRQTTRRALLMSFRTSLFCMLSALSASRWCAHRFLSSIVRIPTPEATNSPSCAGEGPFSVVSRTDWSCLVSSSSVRMAPPSGCITSTRKKKPLRSTIMCRASGVYRRRSRPYVGIRDVPRSLPSWLMQKGPPGSLSHIPSISLR
mmetsp:Transcript_20811/g.52361  ORF Transcript_20811/g.52361 Transcript_20811/m.52361 type:complete len:291 (-) Transcript_20811:617-1489(-)